MTRQVRRLAIAATLAALATTAFAQGHAPGGSRYWYDNRYGHNHYYPPNGFVAPLPRGSIGVGWNNDRYWYGGGVWYRPHQDRYVVAAPPYGITAPALPAGYASLQIGGAPYYYANGTYYTQDAKGFTVVAPPPGADSAQVTTPRAPTPAESAEPIVTARAGQNFEQTLDDRGDCNQLAAQEPGAAADAATFRRAFVACLESRGYAVK